jgi:hypothetical protein
VLGVQRVGALGRRAAIPRSGPHRAGLMAVLGALAAAAAATSGMVARAALAAVSAAL